ncbi:MAG TPA: ribosome biogenesis GTP-binding protein YihA/YsxC [Bacteroidales bacterium]|nr:ribosome biogenesis GTP-binding protein YihA/YsxC [Bacteroidales bacterium]
MKKITLQAEFVKSCKKTEDCPAANLPEYAFIGRSNVGKSSLINMLVERKNLARTSNTPGKTQLLNFFLVNDAWYLVDLPGYGYAKRSKKIKDSWDEMISNYLINRKNLMNTFVLIDSRLKPQQLDLVFMENLALNHIPFSMVFTKTDKLKPIEFERNMEIYKTELQEKWEDLPSMLFTSSKKRDGRDTIINVIEEYNKLSRQGLH